MSANMTNARFEVPPPFLVCDLRCGSSATKQMPTPKLSHCGPSGAHRKGKQGWRRNAAWQIFTQNLLEARGKSRRDRDGDDVMPVLRESTAQAWSCRSGSVCDVDEGDLVEQEGRCRQWEGCMRGPTSAYTPRPNVTGENDRSEGRCGDGRQGRCHQKLLLRCTVKDGHRLLFHGG